MRRKKSVYDLAEEVGGMYALVVAAAKRARQIREGRHPVVDCNSSNPLTIALTELLEGRVVVRQPGEKDEAEGETEVVEVAGLPAEDGAGQSDGDEVSDADEPEESE